MLNLIQKFKFLSIHHSNLIILLHPRDSIFNSKANPSFFHKTSNKLQYNVQLSIEKFKFETVLFQCWKFEEPLCPMVGTKMYIKYLQNICNISVKT